MLPSVGRHSTLLVAYLKPQRSRVLWLAVLLLSSIGLELINPQIVRFFIDTAQKGGPVGALKLAAIAFLVITLVQQIVALGAAYFGAVVGWEATNRLRADLLRHCLDLDLPFHKSHTPGELIERIDGDVTLLANFFSQFTINILGNALLVAGILIIMARTNPWLGLGLTAYCLATVAVLRALQQRAVRRYAIDRQASAEQYGAIEERLVGTEDIRGVGAESYVLGRLLGVMQRRLRTNRRARLAGNLSFFSVNFLYVMVCAIGLGLGAFLFERHQITLGTAYLIIFYIGMLASPLDKIRLQIQDMQQASAGIGRVDTLLHTQATLPEGGVVALRAGPPAVYFDRVSFRYEDGESVLRDLTFSVRPGRTLGLLGRTGSGKTTLTRLLTRLYDPLSGRVRLDDVDLRDLSTAGLRHGVGMVTQDVQLFRASVRDNLTFFRSGTSDAEILGVLRELDLWEWYRNLPDGLDTVLGPGGAGLSAGQAQLLAFARVFLRDPGLVILDEASSRLDPASERVVERAVDLLLTGRTGIIVAHRLRTVGRVDDIMILDDGRIAEHGPRVDLLLDPASRFSRLLRAGLEEVLV
ncbi:MAG: ABC transporter ATP-binding protein/permease [Chloroflexota bacterium]|nr:ABC transporter ATP-binding protein/permease [Chloroflexota bacterium]